MDQPPAVVFDVGSSLTRVGLSSAIAPLIFPTLVSTQDDEIFVGLDAKSRGRNRRVLEFDYLEKIYEHSYKQLDVDPKHHLVVLNNMYPMLKIPTEKMAQIIFEKFQVPGLHMNYSPVMALYGCNFESVTGLVVDSGFTETQFYPIYEGHILEWPVRRGVPVGGDYITSILYDKWRDNGINCDYETVEKIKEKSFYVSDDFLNEENPPEETFSINEKDVTLSKEKYQIPEELFTSTRGLPGIHEYIINVIGRCDPEIRNMLFEKLVLTGGNTFLPGFVSRLEKEIAKILPGYFHPKIISLENRQNLPWIGGTKIASLPNFKAMCMTLEEYNEYGPSLTHRKFF